MDSARLDLKMEHDEKAILARGAAIMGTSVSAFVRAAAKEKAADLIERESRITMTNADFVAFAAAINRPFKPSAAVTKTLKAAAAVKRA
jgi:uncharacterized protein (DUF1778 family)